MDVEAILNEGAARVDAMLERCVPRADEPPARLHAAMRHLLFPGGKRVRPAFAFAGARAAGAAPERALAMATAVELVHTYSLVHDDLPCMDDDDERRGRPTVHVVFGEATALLAGDALLALAFERIASADDVPPEGRSEAVRALAFAAGSRALAGGQSDDLAVAAGEPADAARIESIHARKTAALIAAAVVGGAALAGAGAALRARLHDFAMRAGVAFQIADDLLDGEQGDGCSLVTALGRENARARAEALLAEAMEAIDELGEEAAELRELARFAVRRQR